MVKKMKRLFSRVALVMLLYLSFLRVHAQTYSTIDDVAQHLPMASALVLKGCGMGSNDTWTTTLATCGATYLAGATTAWALKHTTNELRPDGSDRHSLPSGHTMFAFAGATALRYECGKKKAWIAVAGYGAATLVAIDRVRLRRHYTHDVLCGAVIGCLSGELCFYVKRRLLRSPNIDIAFTGQMISVNYNFD